MIKRSFLGTLAHSAAVAAVLCIGAGTAHASLMSAWSGPPAERAAFYEAEFDRAMKEAERDRIYLAHAGQLSKKDDCHRQKSRGERHWHVSGSKRGGPCVKVDGRTFYFKNHALCAKARVAFVREKERWRGNFRAAAEALKDCIIEMKPPGGG